MLHGCVSEALGCTVRDPSRDFDFDQPLLSGRSPPLVLSTTRRTVVRTGYSGGIRTRSRRDAFSVCSEWDQCILRAHFRLPPCSGLLPYYFISVRQQYPDDTALLRLRTPVIIDG